MTDPTHWFYYKAGRTPYLNVSVRPAEAQRVAEALEILRRHYPHMSKSALVAAAIVECAERLESSRAGR